MSKRCSACNRLNPADSWFCLCGHCLEPGRRDREGVRPGLHYLAAMLAPAVGVWFFGFLAADTAIDVFIGLAIGFLVPTLYFAFRAVAATRERLRVLARVRRLARLAFPPDLENGHAPG